MELADETGFYSKYEKKRPKRFYAKEPEKKKHNMPTSQIGFNNIEQYCVQLEGSKEENNFYSKSSKSTKKYEKGFCIEPPYEKGFCIELPDETGFYLKYDEPPNRFFIKEINNKKRVNDEEKDITLLTFDELEQYCVQDKNRKTPNKFYSKLSKKEKEGFFIKLEDEKGFYLQATKRERKIFFMKEVDWRDYCNKHRIKLIPIETLILEYPIISRIINAERNEEKSLVYIKTPNLLSNFLVNDYLNNDYLKLQAMRKLDDGQVIFSFRLLTQNPIKYMKKVYTNMKRKCRGVVCSRQKINNIRRMQEDYIGDMIDEMHGRANERISIFEKVEFLKRVDELLRIQSIIDQDSDLSKLNPKYIICPRTFQVRFYSKENKFYLKIVESKEENRFYSIAGNKKTKTLHSKQIDYTKRREYTGQEDEEKEPSCFYSIAPKK